MSSGLTSPDSGTVTSIVFDITVESGSWMTTLWVTRLFLGLRASQAMKALSAISERITMIVPGSPYFSERGAGWKLTALAGSEGYSVRRNSASSA